MSLNWGERKKDMENFTKFLTNYGIGGLIIIVFAFGLTQLIKIPIKKKAEAWAEKNGVDKSVITKWLFILPFVLAFIGSIINVWALGGWGRYILSPKFDWTTVITETLACSGLAGSIFGIASDFQKADISKKIAELTTENSKVAEARATIASETASASQKAKAEKEAAKAKLRADKLAKKQEELKAKQDAEVKKLEAQIAKLKGTDTKVNAVKAEEPKATTEDTSKPIERIN